MNKVQKPERLLLCFICFLLLPAGFGFDAPCAKTVLTMNHQFPETAAPSKIDRWFANRIKEATEGEVEIRIFWSNGLGAPRENLALLRNGDIHMAAMSAGYFPSKLPLFSAPNSIPMGMDNICQASALMHAFMTRLPAFMEEAEENGIRPLFFHLLNPYLLVTREPVTRFSELSGKRIRTWGKDMPRLVRAAGATPVKLFLPDLHEAMKRGVIDGCPFSVDLTVSYRIHELAKHITEVVMWAGPSYGIWINGNTWNKLPVKYRRIIMETAEQAREMEIPATLSAEKSARDFLIQRGVQFHPFPENELDAWRSRNPDFFSDLISEMEKRGKADAARTAVKMWREIRGTHTECP